MVKDITPSQRKVLDFIRESLAAGTSPTLENIGEKMGWSSASTSRGVVESLKRLGLIRRKKCGRKIALVKPPESTVPQ